MHFAPFNMDNQAPKKEHLMKSGILIAKSNATDATGMFFLRETLERGLMEAKEPRRPLRCFEDLSLKHFRRRHATQYFPRKVVVPVRRLGVKRRGHAARASPFFHEAAQKPAVALAGPLLEA
jgi:hypothetical protein